MQYILQKQHSPYSGLTWKTDDLYWQPGHSHYEPYKVHQQVGLKIHLPGDLVTNKFRPRYHGPYEVIQVNENMVTYVVKSIEGKQYKVHHRQLRKWLLPPLYLENNTLFQEWAMKLNDDDLFEEKQGQRMKRVVEETPELVTTDENDSSYEQLEITDMDEMDSLDFGGFELTDENVETCTKSKRK